MKNYFRQITGLVLIFVCCIGSSCLLAVDKEYTIILYLNGCDLESDINKTTSQLNGEASDAIEALQKNYFDDSKLNVIVVTGGTKQWRNNQISNRRCEAWKILGKPEEVMEDGTPKVIRMKSLNYFNDGSMMSRDTLQYYVTWVKENCPAKKYVLIFWNHGGGCIGGFGTDELNNNQSISIADIKDALTPSFGKNSKLELVVFACCLMGNFEIAYKLKDCAKYMVASEELSYGDAFEGLIEKLVEKKYDMTGKARGEEFIMTGEALGEEFIKAHFKGAYSEGRLYTFSLIDLTRIEVIQKYIDEQLIPDLDKLQEQDKADFYRNLAVARARSESFNERARDSHGLTDMYHFLKCIGEEFEIDVKDKVEKALKLIEGTDTRAVRYNKTCQSRSNSHGLSIFFPDRKLDPNLGLQDNLDKYKQSRFSDKSYNFVRRYYDNLLSDKANPSSLIGELNFEPTSKEPGIIDSRSDESGVTHFVYLEADDFRLINHAWFILGEVIDGKFKVVSIDKNTNFSIKAKEATSDEKIVELKTSIPKQGYGCYCIDENPIPIYWDGDVNRNKDKNYLAIGQFAVTVTYKDDANKDQETKEQKFLVVRENKDKDSVEIIGVWDSKNYKGTVIPILTDLDPKDIPKGPAKLLYKVNGQYQEGPSITIPDKPYLIKKKNIDISKYTKAFYVEDVIGRKLWSDRENVTTKAVSGANTLPEETEM